MLERIAEVQGVGLLNKANGKAFTFEKATLLYAENGRGKSTMATIFRSASTGNHTLISARKTVDSGLKQKVVLQFGSGHKVSFENGVWTETRPELIVFDADFIERNVHSGGSVNTDHRKNLLEFALGEAAVTARAALEKSTNDSKVAADKVQVLINQLSTHHAGIELSQFEKLSQIEDIEVKIADLNNRINAASNIAAIQAKPVPKALAEPSFNIDDLFSTLGLSMPAIHENAEKLVKQQIAKLGKQGSENWLSHGQHFDNSHACPYCDQDISGNDLVHAYQTRFNAAYADLKIKVSALQSMVTDGSSEIIIANIEQSVSLAVAKTDGWADSVQIRAIHFDAETPRAALAAFRKFVVSMALRKNSAPAEPLGGDTEKSQAIALWEQVLIPIRSTNNEIYAVNNLISAYKSELGNASVGSLQEQLQQFQLTKYRYDGKVVQLLELLSEARKNVKAADMTKKTARDHLDSLMTTTLSKYQVDINLLLKNFGASFSIKGMSANFRGNAPRSEYGLSLRERDIPLEGVSPSFSTVLSEGDKRTLAFAFFVASTMQDPKLPNQTVVIDDPMCSLDRNRRHHTQTVLKKIHSQAAQLIVLAHDAYFIRDLRDTLKKSDSTTGIGLFQLAAVNDDYTDFALFDVEKECKSVYARHHQLLNDFSNGHGNDHSSIAKAIRPMLEGYLHRRFPEIIGKDQLFGQAVSSIRDALHSSPLYHAKNLVDELNEINSYAGLFHHDTNPDADAISVSPAELKTFVKRALDVVYKSAPPCS